MPDSVEQCPERRALETEVIKRVREVYTAKGADRQLAPNAEREAVRKLEDHIKEQRCK